MTTYAETALVTSPDQHLRAALDCVGRHLRRPCAYEHGARTELENR